MRKRANTRRLSRQIVNFFQAQGCVIVATIDRKGSIHTSCKGIVEIDPKGEISLFDLYQAGTLRNLRKNSHITITALDEHTFQGYSLKGTARVLMRDDVPDHTHKAWEAQITGRLTRRVVRNLKDEKGHLKHPEILMPDPEYLIVVDVKEVIDLRPRHLRE
ncbi:MAG: pyridoxamine 5'-phosphate oxidase family protein [Candidatus Omnitrophica bacterium]|nr:pyridoxamine 5'-phosphate oxidase family protein [Candidatus Omnitrophota bacterium]